MPLTGTFLDNTGGEREIDAIYSNEYSPCLLPMMSKVVSEGFRTMHVLVMM